MVYIIYYLLLMSIINDVTKIYRYCYEIITKKERKEEREKRKRDKCVSIKKVQRRLIGKATAVPSPTLHLSKWQGVAVSC